MSPGPSELTPLLAEAEQATADNEGWWWRQRQDCDQTTDEATAEAAEEAPYPPTRGTLENGKAGRKNEKFEILKFSKS